MISACSEARDRKSPISPHQTSLQRSLIEPKIQPIRCLGPIVLGLRQGQVFEPGKPLDKEGFEDWIQLHSIKMIDIKKAVARAIGLGWVEDSPEGLRLTKAGETTVGE
jgi:hypothetical protein